MAWGAAFVPFIEEIDSLKAMPFLAVYSFALSGATIGILLQVGSRLYWAWLLSLAALCLTLFAAMIAYGATLERVPSSTIGWMRFSISSLVAFSVLLAVKGWLTVWTRKPLRSED